MTTEPQSSESHQEALAPSVLNLLRNLKSELIKAHFLPLKQIYDDSLRNIPRTEPNPAVYVRTQTDRYRESRDACEARVTQQLYDQLAKVMTEASIEIDAWPTADHAPSRVEESAGVAFSCAGSPKAATKETPAVAGSGKSFQATVEDEEESLFVAQSPHTVAANPTSVTGPSTSDITPKVEQIIPKLPPPRIPIFSGIEGQQSRAKTSTISPQIDTAAANTTKQKDHGRNAPSPEGLIEGKKRTMTDFFATSRPTPAKKAKCDVASTSKLPPSVPKPHLSTAKTISLAEVNADECVHHFGQHRGLYVLRCDVNACKRKLVKEGGCARKWTHSKNIGQTVVYFTANPLDAHRAVDHFRGKGHGVRVLKDIYDKFAVRVTDATEDCNLGNPADRDPCLQLGSGHKPPEDVEDSSQYLPEDLKAASKSPVQTPRKTPAVFGEASDAGPAPGQNAPATDSEGHSGGGAAKAEASTATPGSRRKAPARAAASAVTSYGFPIPLEWEDDVVETTPRKKIIRLEAHVNNGKATTKHSLKENGAQREPENAIASAVPTPGPIRTPKGKEREIDMRDSSDSDDSDSSIPAIGVALRKMSQLKSRIV